MTDFGARLLSGFASVVDASEADEIDHILDGLPDPIGQFYRFSLAGSLLRAARGPREAAARAAHQRFTNDHAPSIDPVTRLEGHGKIEIFLDDNGDVDRTYFQVPELRGFEAFCVGRPVEEMPSLTSRICGVLPRGPPPGRGQGGRCRLRDHAAAARSAVCAS